ncbi:FAD-dependent oxidoreductase [Kitasatospora sp. NPDC006697]|uniref:FAD-dependent oxidoreductase n=1 Tax=Kitasatospora sp. NPDC006697 TaxID=3364020 RepID=UPI0036A7FE53
MSGPRTPVAIIGGGLAGAALAWRLGRLGCPVTLFTGGALTGRDATEASGGLLRGYETDPEAARQAQLGLAELRASPELRDWAGYRELRSAYLLRPGTDPGELPPGARAVEAAELPVFRRLPPGTVAVLEPAAGCLSPARLRAALLAAVWEDGGTLRHEAVQQLSPDGELTSGSGGRERFRTVVLAAGPWTPGLLRRWGLPDQGLRVKQIQYTLGRAALPGLPAFVDETTGLYGRPDGPGRALLGLPTDSWPADPGALRPLPAPELARRAAQRLGLADWPGPAARTVTAADCWAPADRPGGLRLRPLPPGGFATFTGGTGGAAKTVLAASRTAAAELLEGIS